jgi:hypothetical protein
VGVWGEGGSTVEVHGKAPGACKGAKMTCHCLPLQVSKHPYNPADCPPHVLVHTRFALTRLEVSELCTRLKAAAPASVRRWHRLRCGTTRGTFGLLDLSLTKAQPGLTAFPWSWLHTAGLHAGPQAPDSHL